MMAGPSLLGTGGEEPGRPILGLFCRCPLSMRMALFIGLCRSLFYCFCTDFERWCWAGRSRTSSVSIVHWPAACSATSPCSALEAASATSVGDLAMAESLASEEPTSEAREASTLVMLGTNGMSQGAAIVEVGGAGSQLSDDAGG
jgi:hypothetical protein